jgi:hypothetical protein
LASFQYTKAQMNQFSHGSAERRHLGFTALLQALVQRFDMWIMLSANNSGNVEYSTDASWTDLLWINEAVQAQKPGRCTLYVPV